MNLVSVHSILVHSGKFVLDSPWNVAMDHTSYNFGIELSRNTLVIIELFHPLEKSFFMIHKFDTIILIQDVYKRSISSVIAGVVQGLNATVFAYGSTGRYARNGVCYLDYLNVET